MNCGVGKNRRLSLVWNQIVLLFYSLTGCNKTSFLIVRGKRWVSFLAVTGYFVKMNSRPEKPPTDCLCIIKRFITVLYDCMTVLTKVALYQHSLKAIYQGSCVRVSTRKGKWLPSPANCVELDTGMYSPLWTTIPQASKSYLGLVRYGCLQGCRSTKCSSPVYDPLCLWWQLWTLHFCKLMIVFKVGNVQ